ncbi:MAG: fasciclin domain-containing protein [Promethearchaeota archaeon]|nr:MAG: fasciclin domain-containing protein [Candidatus Lokiarchaeota archaeon]
MKNLVQTAIDAGDFKMLVKAVQEAGLVDTLSDDGPFTIFAPTDEAFLKIPVETFQSILKDKEKLTEILTYHVVTEKIMSDKVINLKNAKTVNGKDIKIDATDGVKIDKANVIKTDIECSNGVIHVIDEVLMGEFI